MIGLANPWMLLALGAIAWPVLVHMVRREERATRVFPSLMFVRRIAFAEKRRRRIRDRALLALRASVVAAIALAFADPSLELEAGERTGVAPGSDVVLLLDRSYSMSSEPLWQQARAEIRERIEALAPGDRAALVAFDTDAVVLAPLTADRNRLQQALQQISAAAAATDYAAALGTAERVLASSDAQRQTAVLVSDLQRSALDQVGQIPLSARVALEVVPVSAPVGPNAAVLEVDLAPRAERGVADTLLVRVRNTGDADLDDGRLDLLVDGRRASSERLRLAVGQERRLSLPIVLATDRATRVTVRLGDDAVSADNDHHAVLAPRRPITVALLEPTNARTHHAVHLEHALRLARGPEVDVRRVDARQLLQALAGTVDVVALDDVATPRADLRESLGRFVAAGGGLLVLAGPSLDDAWPGGRDGFVPGGLGPASERGGAGARIRALAADHPLWAAPGLQRGEALEGVRVFAVRELRPETGDAVLARLDDGTPLLLERGHGAGRSLVLATTADPGWSTLGLEPGFVPLAHALVARLAARDAPIAGYRSGQVVDLDRHAANLPGGAAWRRYLAEGAPVIIETPDGAAVRLSASRRALFNGNTPGIYEAHRADGAAPSLPFAVNAPRTESLLHRGTAAELEARVTRRARPPASAVASRKETMRDFDADAGAWWLIALAAVAVMLESLTANRIDSRRRVERPIEASR